VVRQFWFEHFRESRFCGASELTIWELIGSINTSAFKGSNERLSRVETCEDDGHSDASSIKRVTSSSEDDCFVFSIKKGSLSAAAKSRI